MNSAIRNAMEPKTDNLTEQNGAPISTPHFDEEAEAAAHRVVPLERISRTERRRSFARSMFGSSARTTIKWGLIFIFAFAALAYAMSVVYQKDSPTVSSGSLQKVVAATFTSASEPAPPLPEPERAAVTDTRQIVMKDSGGPPLPAKVDVDDSDLEERRERDEEAREEAEEERQKLAERARKEQKKEQKRIRKDLEKAAEYLPD